MSDKAELNRALQLLEAELSAERRATIEALVSGKTPIEKWQRHTGVTTFADLQSWAENQLREVLILRSYRDSRNGGIPTEDDLGEYLIGKSGTLSMLLANMRQIVERTVKEDI